MHYLTADASADILESRVSNGRFKADIITPSNLKDSITHAAIKFIYFLSFNI